jgi:phage shock protein PspC (stress-responsive transcriptional regulator)
MNKVTTINLNGSAYQLEEGGYDLLKKYLAQAKKKLADDPDKDEVLDDFERAIAEKCSDRLRQNKNVITEKEMEQIIDEMGPVEAADDKKHEKVEIDQEQHPKRLYTLREGAIIGGVANGLAAYFNVDVTIVRLLFVLLVLVTSGAGILLYLLMMILVPEARTQEQKAELRGERFSAQDVLQRAKSKYGDISTREHWHKVAANNQPALSNVGEAILTLVRVLSMIVAIGLTILLAFLTAAWISGMWWLVFGHVHLDGQLNTIPLWTVGMAATATYFFIALPLGVIGSFFARVGVNRPFGKQSIRVIMVAAAVWIVSIGIIAGVGAVTGGRISEYQSSHAYIYFGQRRLCINSNLCGFDQPLFLPPAPIPPDLPLQPQKLVVP